MRLRSWAVLSPFVAALLACSAPPATSQAALFVPAPGPPIAVGAEPNGVALADVDGNGSPDIVVASSGAANVTVLLNDGRGRFRAAPGSPLKAGPAPHLVAAGDLNGDGKADLAVTSHDSNSIFILVNRGGGTFAAAREVEMYTGVQPHNHGLALADVNGDGKLDLTAGHQDTGEIAIALGDGRGSFAPAVRVKAGRAIYPHTVADVNEDDAADIVAPDLSGAIAVLLGGKNGFTSAPGSPIGTKQRPYAVTVADLNGDGAADIAATHDDIADVTILLGDGRGAFRVVDGAATPRRGAQVVAGDFNHDGRMDLAVAAQGAAVLLGDGRGKFANAPGSPYVPAHGVWKIAAADLNGDGKLDLVTTDFEAGVVHLLLAR